MNCHLLTLDGSKAAERVIPHAVAAARSFGAGLRLLHVLETDAPSPQGAVDSVAWRMRRAEAGAYLEAWRTRLEEHGLVVTTELREGRAAEQILDVVRARRVDLIVLATQGGRSSIGTDLGDTAQKVVASGCVSFLLVRSSPTDDASEADLRYRRVLAPLDASSRSECALPVATSVARTHGASLILAHVAPVPDLPGSTPPTADDVELRDRVVARNRERGSAYLAGIRARVAERDLDVATRVVVASDVGRAVCRSIRDEAIDLVVVSAHGGGCHGEEDRPPYGGVARALISEGSVALWVVQDLPVKASPESAQPSGLVFSIPSRLTESATRA